MLSGGRQTQSMLLILGKAELSEERTHFSVDEGERWLWNATAKSIGDKARLSLDLVVVLFVKERTLNKHRFYILEIIYMLKNTRKRKDSSSACQKYRGSPSSLNKWVNLLLRKDDGRRLGHTVLQLAQNRHCQQTPTLCFTISQAEAHEGPSTACMWQQLKLFWNWHEIKPIW